MPLLAEVKGALTIMPNLCTNSVRDMTFDANKKVHCKKEEREKKSPFSLPFFKHSAN